MTPHEPKTMTAEERARHCYHQSCVFRDVIHPDAFCRNIAREIKAAESAAIQAEREAIEKMLFERIIKLSKVKGETIQIQIEILKSIRADIRARGGAK